MSSINKVHIIGRIGKDPETRSFTSSKAVANISVATSESYKDAQGQKVEKTEWHRIAAWGKLAGIVSQYAGKGDLISIEGKLQTREFENKEGVKQYRTEIVANRVTFLQKASGSSPLAQANQEAEAAAAAGDGASGDDLPF